MEGLRTGANHHDPKGSRADGRERRGRVQVADIENITSTATSQQGDTNCRRGNHVCPPSFRVSRPRRPGVLGRSRRTDGDYLGKLVGIRENKLVEQKNVHVKGLGSMVQLKKKRGRKIIVSSTMEKNCSLAMMKRNQKLETSRKRRRKKCRSECPLQIVQV